MSTSRIDVDSDEFRNIVASSSSFSEIARRMGYRKSGGITDFLHQKCSKYQISTSHLSSKRGPKSSIRSVDKTMFAEVVANSRSFRDVAIKLGWDYDANGSVYRLVKERIKENNLDVSHFLGAGWSAGKDRFCDKRLASVSETRKLPWNEVFVVGRSKRVHGFNLLARLVEAGLKKYVCESCGLSCWQNVIIRLEVDHINGDRTDNRVENLRLLCPNCHSQTETYSRRYGESKSNRFERWYSCVVLNKQ